MRSCQRYPITRMCTVLYPRIFSARFLTSLASASTLCSCSSRSLALATSPWAASPSLHQCHICNPEAVPRCRPQSTNRLPRDETEIRHHLQSLIEPLQCHPLRPRRQVRHDRSALGDRSYRLHCSYHLRLEPVTRSGLGHPGSSYRSRRCQCLRREDGQADQLAEGRSQFGG